MMEEKAREHRTGRDTWREKEWYDVFAPPMFGETKIGETPASDPRLLEGRVLETTLGDLIDDFSKSHVKLYFQIEKVEGNRALTRFVGHDMASDYIRSQVRRRASKVDCICTVTTQDGYKLRVSSMVTTLRRIQSSQIGAIRAGMREIIERRASERNFDQFIQEVVLGKLSSDIYKVVKKICPVKRVEVRKTKVLSTPAKG
jgi:small subunit ribosomal protein S3Ae